MSFDLATRLAERRAANLYRQRPLLESPQGPLVQVDGRELLAFCSNDYLGLANHPEVIAAMRAGAGYVCLFAEKLIPGVPAAIGQKEAATFTPDPRLGALLSGPERARP